VAIVPRVANATSVAATGASGLPPFAWRRVLHFANAHPTAKNWTAILLQRRGRPGPNAQVFGLKGADEVAPILAEFRRVLSRLVAYRTPRAAEFSDILTLINERARLRSDGWLWERGTGRTFHRIETATSSFEESLYAQLGLALMVESFLSVTECRRCGRFFYVGRRRNTRLCSPRCRVLDARARAARHRSQNPDKYREQQRRLMAARRAAARQQQDA
jgi:hypothetical protein